MRVNRDEAILAEKQLLWKLYKYGAWGTKHLCESNLQKGFPPHLRGKTILEIAEGLRKRGFLGKHATHHEPQWYLNWGKKAEIEEILKDFLQMRF